MTEASNRNTTDAWRRFRRLMALVAGLAVVSIGAALWFLQASGVPMRLHFMIATALGIGLSLLLAGALMGLAFVSARSGHDDAAHTPPPESGSVQPDSIRRR